MNRHTAHIVSALAVLGALAWGGAVLSADTRVSDRYDDMFRKYSKRYFGIGFDWRVFKAQAMAESGLVADATSHDGALGVMQLLPTTYSLVRSTNRELATVDGAEGNIAAGICHDRNLWNDFAAMTDPHRQSFTFASYNAGEMTVWRAQKVAHDRALDEMQWPNIEIVAPAVPQWRYRETLTYLGHIKANLARMDASGRVK